MRPRCSLKLRTVHTSGAFDTTVGYLHSQHTKPAQDMTPRVADKKERVLSIARKPRRCRTSSQPTFFDARKHSIFHLPQRKQYSQTCLQQHAISAAVSRFFKYKDGLLVRNLLVPLKRLLHQLYKKKKRNPLPPLFLFPSKL